jgi:methionine-rich copper-binding protein CopC
VTVTHWSGTDVLVGVDEIAFSDRTILLNQHLATGMVTVAGTLLEGRTLTATASGLADPDGMGAISWQWLRDGMEIAGATATSYQLAGLDAGTSIVARARFVDGDGNTESTRSTATAPVLAGDRIAPVVVTFSPADGATGVDRNGLITLTFSEAIRTGSGLVRLFDQDGNAVLALSVAGPQVSVAGASLVIDPAGSLHHGQRYELRIDAGAATDLAGNGFAPDSAPGLRFKVAENRLQGTGAGDRVAGADTYDNLDGLDGNDTLQGAGGNDTLDGGAGADTAVFAGQRAGYTLGANAAGYLVADGTAGRDGADTLTGVERLLFSDRNVDLTMAATARTVDASDLKTLEELYVGFFNRIPEAEGLGYWIGQLQGGMSLGTIANRFYEAGVAFGVYNAAMTDEAFIAKVYHYVLGRAPATPDAPPPEDIDWWAALLDNGTFSKGTMVLRMLSDTHTVFENHPQFGFVARHLDNKAAVAHYYAVQQGLSMNVQQDNIAFGVELAALITPDDTAAAIAFIGVNAFSMS